MKHSLLGEHGTKNCQGATPAFPTLMNLGIIQTQTQALEF